MTAPSPSRFSPEAAPPAGGAPSPDALLDARFFEHPFPETLSPEALFDRLLAFFREARGGRRLILAIDGRSAAGKSTLAGKLKESLDAERLPAALFHMDDFFLPPEKRSAERLALPGENVDHERFLEEVLLPLKQGKPFSYRAYDCRRNALLPPVFVTPTATAIALVEGSYACHPSLMPFYDLSVFLDISPAAQRARLIARETEESARRFFSRWIPLEERYFSSLAIESRCRFVCRTA